MTTLEEVIPAALDFAWDRNGIAVYRYSVRTTAGQEVTRKG